MPISGLLDGRYRIKDTSIGDGGMGIVYRALDEKLNNKPVAVKTIKGVADEASIAQFRKEVDALAELCHANIVDILDVGEFVDGNGRKPYFVMPLLRGRDLDKLLKTSGPRLDPGRLVAIICQACKALQEAHDRNIIHRDLKPSNLFILNDDSVKVIDFGVLHLAGGDSGAVAKGTLPYMAPEQIDGKVITQSDIWSLGVVCYEALTGSRPFKGETLPELVNAIRSHIPPSISELNPVVPHLLVQVVHKALAKQSYHRPSSAKEFSDLLQCALRNEPIPQFDRSKIKSRLSQIRKVLSEGDGFYAREMLAELQFEGHIDPEISLLEIQIADKMRARTVYQLLESARLRMEEEDYWGALPKLQSVLDLDPHNIDAKALKKEVENGILSAGVHKWYRIAQQHLDNKLFSKAREAVEEILKIDPNHKDARNLLFEIKDGEQEQERLRQELKQLYDSALKAYRNGEISSALNKLERGIALGKSLSAQSQTDAQHVRLYDEIRRERDELEALYAEGRKALESKDFVRARDICKQVLDRRTQDPLCKALQIEVDEAERQARSEAIAKHHTRIEAELDLERKFQFAKEALNLFPNEQTFADAVQLLRQKRDLVKGIVSKARYYESQESFTEARGQWDTLRNIYPTYPNLQYEVDQLNRKQQQSLEEQAKTERLQKIERALDSGNYLGAGESLNRALAEFPGDAEFIRLKSKLDKAIQDQWQSQSLLDEGQQLAASGNWLAAIQKLRNAREFDSNSVPIRLALHATLIDYAQILIQQDRRKALPFCEEALELDPNGPVARELRQQIEDANKHERIDCLVREIKNLRNDGRQQEALKKSKESLQEFPNEFRLQQLNDELRSIENSNALNKTAQMPKYAAAASAGTTGTQAKFQTGHTLTSSPEKNISATNVVSGVQSSRTTGSKQSRLDEKSHFQSVVHPYPERGQKEAPHRVGKKGNHTNKGNFRFNAKIGAAVAACLLLIITALTFWGKFALSSDRSDTHQQESSKVKKPQMKTDATDTSSTSNSEKQVPVPPITTGSNPNNSPINSPRGQSPSDTPAPPVPRRTLIAVTFWTHPGGGSHVKVDNRSDLTCSPTPCELEIPTGKHAITFSADNYRVVKRDIQLPGDNTVSVDLPEEVQSVYVTSKPERLKLIVDGKEQGETPMQLNLIIGEHHFKVTNNNGLVQEKSYKVVKEDDLLILRFDLPSSSEPASVATPNSSQPPSGALR